MRLPHKLKEFLGADLRALGIFRIALGFLLLFCLADRAAGLRAFYTDQGVFHGIVARLFSPPWNFSIHYHFGSLAAQLALFSLSFFFAFLLLIGYRTRLACLISWILFLSLSLRNAPINHGGNHLMWILLFWSQFLPLGARYSADNILVSRCGLSPHGDVSRILSFGTAAFCLQIAFMYSCAGFAKFLSPEWCTGKGVYYALAMKYYTQPFGLLLLQYPAVMKFLTYFVMLFELLGPVLLFMPGFTVPARLLGITGFMGMQVGFALGLSLDLFPWLSLIAMIPLVPGMVWDNLEGGRGFDRIRRVCRRGTEFVLEKFKINTFVGRPTLRLSRKNDLLAAFFLVAMIALNFSSFGALQVPMTLRRLASVLHIEQVWFMFVPPGDVSFWVVASGKLSDGTFVDLFKNGAPLEWDQPDKVSGKFKNRHWRILAEDLAHSYIARKNPRLDILSPFITDYLCREWNSAHAAGQRLEEVHLLVLHKPILPDYTYGPVQNTAPYEDSCPS